MFVFGFTRNLDWLVAVSADGVVANFAHPEVDGSPLLGALWAFLDRHVRRFASH